jgi:hypothetical protein
MLKTREADMSAGVERDFTEPAWQGLIAAILELEVESPPGDEAWPGVPYHDGLLDPIYDGFPQIMSYILTTGALQEKMIEEVTTIFRNVDMDQDHLVNRLKARVAEVQTLNETLSRLTSLLIPDSNHQVPLSMNQTAFGVQLRQAVPTEFTKNPDYDRVVEDLMNGRLIYDGPGGSPRYVLEPNWEAVRALLDKPGGQITDMEYRVLAEIYTGVLGDGGPGVAEMILELLADPAITVDTPDGTLKAGGQNHSVWSFDPDKTARLLEQVDLVTTLATDAGQAGYDTSENAYLLGGPGADRPDITITVDSPEDLDPSWQHEGDWVITVTKSDTTIIPGMISHATFERTATVTSSIEPENAGPLTLNGVNQFYLEKYSPALVNAEIGQTIGMAALQTGLDALLAVMTKGSGLPGFILGAGMTGLDIAQDRQQADQDRADWNQAFIELDLGYYAGQMRLVAVVVGGEGDTFHPGSTIPHVILQPTHETFRMIDLLNAIPPDHEIWDPNGRFGLTYPLTLDQVLNNPEAVQDALLNTEDIR